MEEILWARCNDVLVVKGTTLQFNPLFDADTITRSLEEDPERYGAEYNSIWRDDLSTFLSRELLRSVVDRDIIVRPPEPGVLYFAGCDPSGGRNDSFPFALAHRKRDGMVILDLLFERRAPFTPSQVVSEIADIMHQYKVPKLIGDGYGAESVPDAFPKVNVRYEKSELDRSGVYMSALPLFTSGNVRLLDNSRMICQFAALERRTFSTGRDRIDPGPGHDDLANAAAIALSLASMKKRGVCGNISDATVARAAVPMRLQGGRRPPFPGVSHCVSRDLSRTGLGTADVQAAPHKTASALQAERRLVTQPPTNFKGPVPNRFGSLNYGGLQEVIRAVGMIHPH